MDPNLKVQHIPGIGTSYAKKLNKLEIFTLGNLIYHFPFRYDDYSSVQEIQNLTAGEKLTIQGTILQIKTIRTRTGKFLTQAQLSDESGIIDIIWFNQSYLTKTLKPGTPVSLSGKISSDYGKPKLISPTYEILKTSNISAPNQTTHTGRLVPVYPETEGLSSKWIRTRIKELLPIYTKTNPDFLPQTITNSQNLENITTALTKIHFPQNYQEVDEARNRLAFDELFLTQLLSQTRKAEWTKNRKAKKIDADPKLIQKFINSLPFELTSAQKRVHQELLADLAKTTPANRLLEGDVGSGKTIIAAIGALATFTSGQETLVAAPTEILTLQHYKLLKELLEPFKISVGIWTASKKIQADVTVGTHALLSSYKPKKPVGFVVVDEQHRFGVAQRAKLFLDTSGKPTGPERLRRITPHLLTMTATPIPRTLALTMYGDLDLSVLDEMPKGRQKISTYIVPNAKRGACYKFIEKETELGHQTFIVTPFVEPSESMQTVKSATIELEKLKSKFSPKIKLGLLHGRLKSKEKEVTIDKFKAGKIDVLVATPVVEVGIDVPNATIIVIESADRFGLAQLHQLRGRVGRGEHKSYCFLFTDSTQENSTKRLQSMEKIHVGFELAEIDLKLRGAGEVFGLKQSGFQNFKIADLSNHQLVSAAQIEAKKLLSQDSSLKKYPLLSKKLESLKNQYSQPN